MIPCSDFSEKFPEASFCVMFPSIGFGNRPVSGRRVTLTRSPIANSFNEFANDSNIAIAPPQKALSSYILAPAAPTPPILTQDSGADTLCLDIDFLTIRIPRQTSGIGRLHEGLDEIVGYASRYRHSSVRLRGS
jgi:hypothetical protein